MHNPNSAIASIVLRRRHCLFGARATASSANLISTAMPAYPHARVTAIAAAGHAPQLEQPEEFARVLFAFLEA